MSDDPVGDAIRAARYAEAIMARTAAGSDWQPPAGWLARGNQHNPGDIVRHRATNDIGTVSHIDPDNDELVHVDWHNDSPGSHVRAHGGGFSQYHHWSALEPMESANPMELSDLDHAYLDQISQGDPIRGNDHWIIRSPNKEALRRLAGESGQLWGDWQNDPSGESGSPNGRAETYRADITDDHHMTVFRKNSPPVYDDDDTDELGQAYAEAERLYPHPVNMDTPWSYHLHGVGHNDNPYLKFHTPYDDNPHHTGFPDRETAQRAAEAAYQTFAPGGHGPSASDPDDQQDPFDPRLLGASRTASVYDWKPYTPTLIGELQDNNLWDGGGVDQRSWETRSKAGDHYYIRPAGAIFNELPADHPHRWTGDPNHWEVDHLPPEYGHDPEGYMGDIYGPTAMHSLTRPVEGVGPEGFSSMQHAMDWVAARHPEEGFDPDDHQDPFDPRLLGASRRLAANEDLLGQLHGEFHDWYAEHGNEKLNWAGRGPLGNWHQIENFLKDRYPEAHKGLTTGKEQAGPLLDNGYNGDTPGVDECPKCFGHPFHAKDCAHCGGTGESPVPMAYETGPDTIARNGYDPKEIAAGMLLLHNRTHPHRSDLEQGDNDRLSEIARMRSQMQREGRLDTADIIRLAGDGMSWEDTMAHIDAILGEGDPDTRTCEECGVPKEYQGGVIDDASSDIGDHHLQWCSLHPGNIS